MLPSHLHTYLVASMVEQVHRTSLREKASEWPYSVVNSLKSSAAGGIVNALVFVPLVEEYTYIPACLQFL